MSGNSSTAIDWTEHLGLVRKYTARFKRRFDFDDIFQHGLIGLWKAAGKYNPDRGAFSTIAMYYVRSQVGEYFNSLPKFDTVSLFSPVNDEGTELVEILADDTEDVETTGLRNVEVAELLEALPAKDRVIVWDRASGYTLKETAARVGVSPERVRQRERKALERLQNVVG